MSTIETTIKTPNNTPTRREYGKTENILSTPLFVPPTPMLKELGYGTGLLKIRVDFFNDNFL